MACKLDIKCLRRVYREITQAQKHVLAQVLSTGTLDTTLTEKFGTGTGHLQALMQVIMTHVCKSDVNSMRSADYLKIA